MLRNVRKNLGLERLESKNMLAGDVVVSLVGGNLLIHGDDAANQIAVTAGEAEGSLVIRGLDGTTVRLRRADGPAPATGLVVEGVRGQVSIAMGAGDDVVAIHGAQFLRGLSIATGAGADVVRIGVPPETPAPESELADAAGEVDSEIDADVTVRGALLVRTGSENDRVRIADVAVGGVLGVATDGGDDTVLLGADPADESEADGEPTEEAATLRVRLGVGVSLGDGVDSAVLRDVASRGLVGVDGGAGADEISARGLKALGLGIRGGGGDAADSVNLANVDARHAAVGAGAGADRVRIVHSTFATLAVELGAGDDALSIHGVAAVRALLAGGAGTADELDAADNDFGHVVIAGFEIPEGANTPAPTRPLRALLARAGRR